jgi:hypothetical protein
VPTVAQPVKSSAQNSGSSYVDKLKINLEPPPASGGPPPASAAQAVPTVAQPVKSSAQNSGSSYVDKLKVNVNRFERLTRNVLEINLEKDSSVTFINLEPETVLSNLGVDIKTQVEAVQTYQGIQRRSLSGSNLV